MTTAAAGSQTPGAAADSRNPRRVVAAATGNSRPVVGDIRTRGAGSCRQQAVAGNRIRVAGAGSRSRAAGAGSRSRVAGEGSCRAAGAGSCRAGADTHRAVGRRPAGGLRGEEARHRACPRRACPRAPLVGSYSRHHALRQGQEYRSISRAATLATRRGEAESRRATGTMGRRARPCRHRTGGLDLHPLRPGWRPHHGCLWRGRSTRRPDGCRRGTRPGRGPAGTTVCGSFRPVARSPAR